jgi:uncharacterized membrane protein YphA (DoxX/SURF4 family)
VNGGDRRFLFGMALLRVGFGLMLFSNGLSKLTGWDGIHPFPGFLINSEGARGIIQSDVQTHPVAIYHDFIQNVVVPNWSIFGPLIMLTELATGLSLILGAFTPLGGLIGALFILHLNFANWDRNIWAWEYAVEWIPLLSIALLRAGRYWGLDTRLAKRFPQWPLT